MSTQSGSPKYTNMFNLIVPPKYWEEVQHREAQANDLEWELRDLHRQRLEIEKRLEETVERAFRLGMSNQRIGRCLEITEAAIRVKARRRGWTRPK